MASQDVSKLVDRECKVQKQANKRNNRFESPVPVSPYLFPLSFCSQYFRLALVLGVSLVPQSFHP